MAAQPPLLQPDTLLFIYYIEGVIPTHYPIQAEHFVGNWVEEDFSFLFFTKPSRDEVAKILAQFPDRRLLDEYEMVYAQWQGGFIEPFRIGRFLFNPTWIKVSPEKDDVPITINSGVVFGNGSHPTTQACLQGIEIACAGKSVKTMLDLGSGTGILALAAAKLGCHKVLAVDYNHLAAKTAHHNVLLNNLSDNILVIHGKAEEHAAIPTDLLVANIHYEVMKDLVRTDGFLRQKWFILSGLLRSEAAKILDYLQTQPVIILKHWHQDDVWHTILGITQAPQPKA